MTVEIKIGDCREVLATMPDQSVHCIVTSPPYFGLRDYGVDGQMGLEPTPDEFVAALVGVLREARRVLRDDGTLWLNLGDSYASSGRMGGAGDGIGSDGYVRNNREGRGRSPQAGLAAKQLIGIPWRVAFALQADGWYLRQDIIWHKPNPMPESVRDRCTKAHEYIFMLSKSPRYFYDAAAIAEPVLASSLARISQATFADQKGGDKDYGNTGVNPNRSMRKTLENFAASAKKQDGTGNRQYTGFNERYFAEDSAAQGRPTRNKRSVWTVTTKPFKGAHFATFPPDLIEPCILAGCPVGGTVLDPFFGAGTTGLVAQKHGRNCIGIELNPEYAALARERIDAPPVKPRKAKPANDNTVDLFGLVA